MQCIYKLNFTEGFYIGKTTNLKARLARHYSSDKTGYKLRDAWENQGYLGHEILEECSGDTLLSEREVYWIDKLKPNLNTLPGGETMSGVNHPRNKTSQEDVEEIVRLYVSTPATMGEISTVTGLPYTRVYDICTGMTHAWATEGIDLDEIAKVKRNNKDDVVFFDNNNVQHTVKYGDRTLWCEKHNIPVGTLSNLANTYNKYGLAIYPHKVFNVLTPAGVQILTEPKLYYLMKELEESKFTIQQVINKRKESKGWKILSEA